MTFEKILVALDGSESGQNAANCAFWLAGKLDASLTAQYVVDPRLIQFFLHPEFGKELGFRHTHETEKTVFNALRKIGNTVLELFRKEAQQKELNVSTLLDEGRVPERILAHSSGFDLLVLGHHGKSAGSSADRMPLGSVAERVVVGSHIPVIIAVEPLTQIDQIVVAYDGSEAARGALAMSEDLAKRIGAKLRVVTVVHGDADRSKAKLLVEDGQKFLREKWGEEVFSIKEGSIGETILCEAKESSHSLLVLGAYGYKDPEENVLGSTTTRVIRNTTSSVLIYRPTKIRKAHSEKKFSFAQKSI